MGAGAQKSGGAAARPAPPPPRSLGCGFQALVQGVLNGKHLQECEDTRLAISGLNVWYRHYFSSKNQKLNCPNFESTCDSRANGGD